MRNLVDDCVKLYFEDALLYDFHYNSSNGHLSIIFDEESVETSRMLETIDMDYKYMDELL